MKELKNNVNTLLWLMVTLSVMVVFLTLFLSSCKSSVNTDQTNTVKEVTVHVTLSSENGRIDSIKVNDKKVEVDKDGNFKVKYNDIIEFKAKPDDGYEVVKWTPESLGTAQTAKMTVAKDLKDLSVSVEFKKDENPPGQGSKETLTVDALKKELMVTDDSPIVSNYMGLGLEKKGEQFLYLYFDRTVKQ